MKIIVSLTSHPERIGNVHEVIKTLLIQNKMPDKIILWLSQTQFKQKEKDLPDKLLKLMDYGLIIRWCDDLKPHKKYFFAMQEFPDDVIITVDDDVYYSPRLIEILYESFLRFPDAVSCTRANRIVIDEDRKTDYDQWEKDFRDCCNEKFFDLLPVGIGGVLYPPHCLPEETFDKEKIKAICLYQDDLWLKAMEIKNKIPTVLVSKGNLLVREMEEGMAHGLYNTINRDGNNAALRKIMEEFDLKTGKTDFLIEQLLSSDNSVKSILHHRDEEKKKIERKFKDNIKNKHLVIYGAGTGARLVMESLLALEPPILPYAFVVTDKRNNPEYIFNLPVIAVDELAGRKDNFYVIVSTAEALHKEIEAILKKWNFVHIVFVRDKVMAKLLELKRDIFELHDRFIYTLSDEVKGFR